MFNIKNDLQLLTPFAPCPEITSVANWHLVVMDEMLMECEIHVRAENVTKKVKYNSQSYKALNT